ncbi:RHS repeat-associated core domain-containing protein [Streptomyces albidoflavus]|uniref:RHS repeat-associated core domain-containing protein n=1 Tax=Streptomyces albidoflavus TaxID=1886 RepID=UPI00342283B8
MRGQGPTPPTNTLGARYLSPDIGRFTQPDPSDQEDYLYAAGDPTNRLDPTGLGFWAAPGRLPSAAPSSPPLSYRRGRRTRQSRVWGHPGTSGSSRRGGQFGRPPGSCGRGRSGNPWCQRNQGRLLLRHDDAG